MPRPIYITILLSALTLLSSGGGPAGAQMSGSVNTPANQTPPSSQTKTAPAQTPPKGSPGGSATKPASSQKPAAPDNSHQTPATQPPAAPQLPYAGQQFPPQAYPAPYSAPYPYGVQQPGYPAQPAPYPPAGYPGQGYPVPAQPYVQHPNPYQGMPPQRYPNQQYPANQYPRQMAPPRWQPAQQPYPAQQAYPPQQQQPAQQPQTSASLGPDNKAPDNMSEFLGHVSSARQLISSGHPSFAVEPLDRAVKLRPRNLSVYFYRGLAYDESGDPSRAVKDYLESLDRAKTVGMDSAELRINLGNSYMRLNFVKDAIVEYQKAIVIDPSNGTAHMQLGRALLTNGDFQGALKSFRRCDSLGFNDPSLPYFKALALAALGQKQEAASELAPLLNTDAAAPSQQLHKLADELKRELK